MSDLGLHPSAPQSGLAWVAWGDAYCPEQGQAARRWLAQAEGSRALAGFWGLGSLQSHFGLLTVPCGACPGNGLDVCLAVAGGRVFSASSCLSPAP